jgi:deazaflavin-dependent oxidoreductase (nitroreductase family)
MVEVGNETFAATARRLRGNERQQAFAKAVAVFPPYGEYQQKTARHIPVFLLEWRANAHEKERETDEIDQADHH